MENRVSRIQERSAKERVWLLEHPHLYTSGTSGNDSDILDHKQCPVYQTGRGGQVTYHGPGQRIAYVMLDLKQRNPDLKAYIRGLEQWLINTLAEFGIVGERKQGRVGIWVTQADGKEEKIAAIGVRIKKWVTMHGIALNVAPDLSYYQGIIPCGVSEHGITSMAKLGVEADYKVVDGALKRQFATIFG